MKYPDNPSRMPCLSVSPLLHHIYWTRSADSFPPPMPCIEGSVASSLINVMLVLGVVASLHPTGSMAGGGGFAGLFQLFHKSPGH